jgi:hypothetical protein
LTKTDDLLLGLNRVFDAYVASFFPFEYENKTYRLVKSYVASPWTRCDVCRNYPIKNVAIIRNSDGQELHVGDNCIDRLTNRKTSKWVKKFRTKRKNIMRNRKYINGLASLLIAYKKSELSVQISEKEIERLQKALERVCNGFNLTRKQLQLVECYLRMSAGI